MDLERALSANEMSDCPDGEDVQPIICDNGSGMIKAGFAGDDAPRACFPTVIGTPKDERIKKHLQKTKYVGDEALQKRDILNLTCPLTKHGAIDRRGDMEDVWRHMFYNELCIQPEEHPILNSEPPLNPKWCREAVTQIMFETFNVPSQYLGLSSVLSLYASGRTTGVVIDSGDGYTCCVPIYDGYALPHAIKRGEISGSDITEYLMKLLNKNENISYSFESFSGKQIVKDIKEKLSYVTTDNLCNEKQYELPDGTIINIGSERFECTEILFDPSLIGKTCNGIAKTLYDSIVACDVDIHRDLMTNIVLSGGNTMFNGINQRLMKEWNKFGLMNNHIYDGGNLIIDGYLRKYYLNYNKFPIYKDITEIMNKYTCYKCNIIDTKKNRLDLPWIGGSILSSLSTFEEMWMLKDDYEEAGPAFVHRYCP
eukprot:303813_1